MKIKSANDQPTIFFNKKKLYRKLLKILLFSIILLLIPKIFIFFLICGLIDVSRNFPFDRNMLTSYFFKLGYITWLLSPINLFLDLLTFRMKPVYALNDFPFECQQEINDLLNHIPKEVLIQALETKMAGKKRGMIFFKWYGKNINNSFQVEDFHKEFKYIKTIGVSAFNKQQSTSRHFGPLRTTLRLLYNLKYQHNEAVYIKVAHHTHFWHDNPLFIFDDTYIHQSFNKSDEIRYCLFVDIIRPSFCFYPIFNGMVKLTRLTLSKVNHIFYNKWDFLQ